MTPGPGLLEDGIRDPTRQRSSSDQRRDEDPHHHYQHQRPPPITNIDDQESRAVPRVAFPPGFVPYSSVEFVHEDPTAPRRRLRRPSRRMMETYFGLVRSPADAIKLFEACRMGILPRVQRRLSEKERQEIRSGSVYVWDEREAGMRRWTDGKSWSASRVSGSFLTYREMEGKRGNSYGPGGGSGRRGAHGKTPDSGRGSDEDQEPEPEGYRYKLDGLMKQSFSITTSNGQHLHLISYFTRNAHNDADLRVPTNDPNLRSIVPQNGIYPETSVPDTPTTYNRGSMTHAIAYAQNPHHPNQPAYHQSGPPPPATHAQYAHQSYNFPPSPVQTPPYSSYSPQQAPPQPSQAASSQGPPHAYPYGSMASPPPHARYDRPPQLGGSQPHPQSPHGAYHDRRPSPPHPSPRDIAPLGAQGAAQGYQGGPPPALAGPRLPSIVPHHTSAGHGPPPPPQHSQYQQQPPLPPPPQHASQYQQRPYPQQYQPPPQPPPPPALSSPGAPRGLPSIMIDPNLSTTAPPQPPPPVRAVASGAPRPNSSGSSPPQLQPLQPPATAPAPPLPLANPTLATNKTYNSEHDRDTLNKLKSMMFK